MGVARLTFPEAAHPLIISCTAVPVVGDLCRPLVVCWIGSARPTR